MYRILFPLLFMLLPLLSEAKTPIFGKAEIDVDYMYEYVCRHNPKFQREVAEAFYNVGERYGIRGDIALCQAIIETGWFRFDNGTAVQPNAHNYCGLGVKKRGDKGCKFRDIKEGVTAMMQHLYAYACSGNLPDGENMVDPRFTYVKRGCAPTWEKLAGRWAMNPRYGKNILQIYSGLVTHAKSDNLASQQNIYKAKVIQRIEVELPDGLIDIDHLSPEYGHDVDDSDDIANNDLFK